MARNATVRRGAKSEYEWDEYSDYLDEDEDDYVDEDDDLELNEPINESSPVETARFSQHQLLKQQQLMGGRKVPMVFGGGKINKTVAGGTRMQTAKSYNTNDASFL